MDEDLFSTDEQRRSFLEMKSTPGENVMKIVDMTTKDWECYINLVNKAASGFERIDSNFERSSTVGKILSHSIACYQEIVDERKSQLIRQTSWLYFFQKFPQPPQTSAIIVLISQLPWTSRQDPSAAKRLQLAGASDDS